MLTALSEPKEERSLRGGRSVSSRGAHSSKYGKHTLRFDKYCTTLLKMAASCGSRPKASYLYNKKNSDEEPNDKLKVTEFFIGYKQNSEFFCKLTHHFIAKFNTSLKRFPPKLSKAQLQLLNVLKCSSHLILIENE